MMPKERQANAPLGPQHGTTEEASSPTPEEKEKEGETKYLNQKMKK